MRSQKVARHDQETSKGASKYCSLRYRSRASQNRESGAIEKIFDIHTPADSARASVAFASLDDRNSGKAAQRILADRLLRLLASRMAADTVGDLEIRRPRESAPRLYRAGKWCELNASVAHSGHWVAVGLASGSAIGVDIQVQDERERHKEISEMLHLDTLAATDREHFFSCWTLREAIAKATNGSVLTPHAVEAELTAACKNRGQLVSAGTFMAMVDVVPPDTHLAVVLDGNSRELQCA